MFCSTELILRIKRFARPQASNSKGESWFLISSTNFDILSLHSISHIYEGIIDNQQKPNEGLVCTWQWGNQEPEGLAQAPGHWWPSFFSLFQESEDVVRWLGDRTFELDRPAF